MNNTHDDNVMLDERLMSRLAEGAGDEQDWARWSDTAGNDAARWRELAEMQRDHAMVQRTMQRVAATADRIGLPAGSAQAPAVLRISAWSGWSIAAMIALASLVWHFAQTNTTDPTQPSDVTTVSDMSASEAFDAYLARGRDEGLVVDELPTRVLVTARALEEGGYELLYLRQVLERVRVPDLYMIEDEPATGEASAMQASYEPERPKRGPM